MTTERRRTVLVLGAGASSHYRFPLGRGLRDDVCRVCAHPTPTLCDISGFLAEDFIGFGQRVAQRGYTSVDWYLEANPDDRAIGRVAIAAALTGYEDPEVLFPGPKDHWYETLLNRWWCEADGTLSQGSHVTIATVNYDRSLEVYLSTAAAGRAGMSATEVVVKHEGVDERVIAAGPSVIHLHGQLHGSYTKTWSADRLNAEGLILLSADADTTPEFERAREAIRSSQDIYFLGFGYDSRTMRRLGEFANSGFVEGKTLSGTHTNIPVADWSRIQSEAFSDKWTELPTASTVYQFVRAHVY